MQVELHVFTLLCSHGELLTGHPDVGRIALQTWVGLGGGRYD